MRKGVFAVTLCASLLGATAAAELPADPRALFRAAQYQAAAAGFEALYAQSKAPADGLNAVVAWRNAGRYAHARVLLARLVSTLRDKDPLRGRAQMLEERLQGLTASLILTGEDLHPEAVVTVNGAPAEHLGEEILVEVGQLVMLVEQEGCDTFTWQGVFLPRQRQTVGALLHCTALPGSLHLSLRGGVGGVVLVDEQKNVVPVLDYDVALSPGRHRVRFLRYGLTLLDEEVELGPKEHRSLDVFIPWRAKRAGFSLMLWTGAEARRLGLSANAALSFGLRQPFLDRTYEATAPSLVFSLALLGVHASKVGSLGIGYWAGMEAGIVNLLPPVWHTLRRGTLFSLDFEPALLRFDIAGRGGYFSDEQEGLQTFFLAPLVLSADSGALHLELQLWAVGLSVYTLKKQFLSNERQVFWAGGVSLSIGTLLLGN